MKPILPSVLVLALTSSLACAEPRKLADDEMAGVTAGLYDLIFIVPVTVIVNNADSTAVGAGAGAVSSTVGQNVVVNNAVDVDQSNQLFGVAPAPPALAGSFWPWADPRAGAADGGTDPGRMWSMIAGMLHSRHFGRGW